MSRPAAPYKPGDLISGLYLAEGGTTLGVLVVTAVRQRDSRTWSITATNGAITRDYIVTSRTSDYVEPAADAIAFIRRVRADVDGIRMADAMQAATDELAGRWAAGELR